MMVPQKTMEQELKGQEKELTDDINNLNKKVTLDVLTSRNPLAKVCCLVVKVS